MSHLRTAAEELRLAIAQQRDSLTKNQLKKRRKALSKLFTKVRLVERYPHLMRI
jgi:hypothetical protein